MCGAHTINAHDTHGNCYRLTVYRELIGGAETEGRLSSMLGLPIDIIGPRGEWVSFMQPGRYLLRPHDKLRAAIELYSDEPAAP